jgi:hypothetical protein
MFSWISDAWNWLWGTSSTPTFNPFDTSGNSGTDSGASPVFSYVLIGAAVFLVIAIIFGELEDVA